MGSFYSTDEECLSSAYVFSWKLTPVLRTYPNGPSLVPIQLRRRPPKHPGEIALSSVPVAESIVHDLIPTIYPSPDILALAKESIGGPPNKKPRISTHSESDPTNGNQDWLPSDSEQDQGETRTISVSITDTPLHRLLLDHAMLGFSFQTAPFAMRALLDARDMLQPVTLTKGPAAPAASSANGSAAPAASSSNASAAPAASSSKADTPDMRQQRIRRSVSVFERDLLAINLHCISKLLCNPRIWAFTLAVEPSPYFGQTGLEVRLSLHDSNKKLVSFHLVGIKQPKPDISRLTHMLHSLCPLAQFKCLGVVAHLEPKEAAEKMADTVTAIVQELESLTTRDVQFLKPDAAVRENCPPLMPLELPAISKEGMEQLVQKYRSRLEKSWTKEEIESITADHKLLCDELGGWVRKTSEGDKNKENSGVAFDKSWDFAGDRFMALREFVGGLASAYLYVPQKRDSPSFSGLQTSSEEECSIALAADLILQEQQFEQLRSYLTSNS